VLKRAGGFRAQAYPYAAVFERVQARLLAEQARDKLIQRIEQTPVETNAGGAVSMETAASMRTQLIAQRQEILTSLRSQPASGRMVINIASDISSWENTPADIELRDGDTLNIPKRPSFIAISGQVYNPISIGYTPGKNLGWYLNRAGGPTPGANKGDIYVLRADGSVVPRNKGLMNPDTEMRRGDVIFVPEKIAGTSVVWQNILGIAQLLSVAAVPLAIALH
jgi:polysaccharide biosynthesis/export protein